MMWRSINAAPRDGSHCVVYKAGWPRAKVMLWGLHPHVPNKCWCWPYDDNLDQPTHYLVTVPALPTTEEESLFVLTKG